MQRPSIVVLASGSGTTFQYLVEKSRQGELAVDICLLVVDRMNIEAIERSKQLGIPNIVIAPKEFSSSKEWAEQMIHVVSEQQPDLIVLAGFLRKIPEPFISFFENKIINTHPSLLPKYGGKGMYGNHVHQAVVENREQESGVTIHFVNQKFDEGPILAQTKIFLDQHETADSLEKRIKGIEKPFLLKTLKQYFRNFKNN